MNTIFDRIAFSLCAAGLMFSAGCQTLTSGKPETAEQNYVVATSTMSAFVDGNPVIDEVKNKFTPFYVYTDEQSRDNHYCPSGWMGDVQDLKFSGAYQRNPRLGKTCFRITYLAKGPEKWAGIYWQNPANNWGTMPGGFDLRGAEALTFWARGEKGGEKIAEIKIGGLTGKYSDSDIAWIGPITLTKEWTQYRMDLKGRDLRSISGGFCFTVKKLDNMAGSTFYFDEIRYE